MGTGIILALADKIIRLPDESGAAEIEKLAAVGVVRRLVPLSRESLYSKRGESKPNASSQAGLQSG
jgi:hypothetical protein